MSKRHLLVSFWVAALCSTILVLFTDIERSVGHWLQCGSPAAAPGHAARAHRGSDRCR